MKAPEKIYLLPRQGGDYAPYWKTDSQDGFGIEYTRTDAFIEKACKKLEKCMYDNLMFQGRLHRKEVIETFIEDFRNYMKGE